MHILVVLSLVEEATYLMYPRLTRITLHPAFFYLIIILLLLQVSLLHMTQLQW